MFFFIGTEAELIKVFPVIMKCQEKGAVCNIIASGQNDLKKNRILDYIKLNGSYIELSQEADIKKRVVGMFRWFISTRENAAKIIARYFNIKDMQNKPMIVHGDTVSTFMGALIGKQLHMNVCHIEAGLRSHHLLNPFPEEIDRMLTSRVARVHFAPGTEAVRNLAGVKGQVVDTQYNTIIDSLAISKEMPVVTDSLESVLPQDYFVFVMHRQENLMNKEFVSQVLNQVEQMAKHTKCVFILHKITENTLNEMGILARLQTSPDFILFHRVDYFDFMKILNCSKYVITDGGSNQEELHYMGKPCLIMRKTTERQEGIGQNARMFGGDVKEISKFAEAYRDLQIPPVEVGRSPSEVIAEELIKRGGIYFLHRGSII